MAWELIQSHTDPDNGVIVERQRRKRAKHGTQIRYVVKTKTARVFTFTHSELFDLTDTLNDVCEMVEEKQF